MELYLEKINRNNSCFSLYYEDEENLNRLEIAQDLLKERVIFDSIVSTNLLELFIMHGENLFLNLPRFNDNHKLIEYTLASHSVTVYFLKQLEKAGFIEIKNFETLDDKVNLDDFSLNFLNFNSKDVTLYTIDFVLTYKKITIDFIEKFNKQIGIDSDSFNYNSEKKAFNYNCLYQLKKMFENMRGNRNLENGIVRNFDRNIKIWHLPLNLFHAFCLTQILNCEEKICQKVLK